MHSPAFVSAPVMLAELLPRAVARLTLLSEMDPRPQRGLGHLALGGLKALRSEVNSELNFCPNFEGLVLGCIDADFCK